MTPAQAKSLVRRIKQSGGDARIYEDYSGRFMYGEKTTGVVIGRYSFYDFKKSKYRSDSLGFDTIVY